MSKNITKDEDFDLLKSLKTLYKERIKVSKIILFFIFLGFFISFTLPVKYKSTIIFTPHASDDKINSNLLGLAGLAGIDLSSGNSNVVSPLLYSKIIDNLFFKREVLSIELDNNLDLKTYLINQESSIYSIIFDNTFGLPFKIISTFSKKNNSSQDYNEKIDNKYFISAQEDILLKQFNSIVKLTTNLKESSVTITSEIDNPVYSSIIVQKTQNLLQNYIIDYNIKASTELLAFNVKNLEQKKEEFEDIQNRLAEFKDKNQVISTSTFNNELFKLENEFALINTVYQELAKQVEQTKVQITKDTPIFTIIKEAGIPRSKSSPRRFLIIIMFGIFGFISAFSYVIFKDSLINLVNKINY